MFRTLKFYPHQHINIEKTLKQFVDFGYASVEQIAEKGEFAHRGSVIDIYPINYESPIRIEIDFDKTEKLFTFSRISGKKISDQNPLIILPFSSQPASLRIERLSINKFEELEKNDN